MNSQPAIHWKEAGYSVRQGFWMKRKQIVEAITLMLREGRVLGLVGPNGAGKTTTIKLGAGLLAPVSGQVTIRGIPATDPNARTSLGLLTEVQYVYPNLKLREWLSMMGGLSGLTRARLKDRMAYVTEQFELSERLGQYMKTLSKGQLQRAGFAQAILHDPDILLLDEPMSGLDPFWRYRFHQIFSDLRAAGKTILFSSHILVDVERLCDDIALVQAGRVMWQGSMEQLTRRTLGYEAVCRTSDPSPIRALAMGETLKQLPQDEWLFTISPERKPELMALVVSEQVALESLRPLLEDIEEIFFGEAKRRHPMGG
uniref:ABC transporter ATP-binding protein n=1 Tax=Desulfatirhabdium butyrativorans TaxID=340467 RepID=A0A7C4MNP3_9BACT